MDCNATTFYQLVTQELPWVPEVFFLFGDDGIERRSRESESQSGKKNKPLVPTDNTLTSMSMPTSFD